MIEKLVVEIFQKINRLWSIGGKLVTPSEDDVLQVLDHAAERLMGEDDLAVLTVGGLKIEKNERGRFDVYVHVGEYI